VLNLWTKEKENYKEFLEDNWAIADTINLCLSNIISQELVIEYKIKFENFGIEIDDNLSKNNFDDGNNQKALTDWLNDNSINDKVKSKGNWIKKLFSRN